MADSHKEMVVIRSSRPRFRNNNDKIAFAVHATFFASGFKLLATGRPALAKDALASSHTQGEVGIEGWNESDEYAFVYANPKGGSKKVLVKCVAVDGKLLVDAVAEGGTEPFRLKIRVEKYATESRDEDDYDAQFKNFDRLVTKLQNNILYKLDEGLKPVTYTTTASTRTSSKRKKEHDPKPVYFAPRPFPLGSLHHPSLLVERPDYSGLIPGPPVGSLPVVRDGFGGGSMLVGPRDHRMRPRFGDQIQPGFMGTTPQPVVPPPGARPDPIGRRIENVLLERSVGSSGSRYDPIDTGFESGLFGSNFDRQPPRSGEDIHPDLQHFRGGFGLDFM